VAGALIATGPVVVVAASFSNVAYERLQLEEGNDVAPLAPPGNDQPGVPFEGDPVAVAVAGWLLFFNLPMGMPPMPMDGNGGWPGTPGGVVGRPPFS